MLNKKNRLTKNRHFQFIYRKGEKVYSKNMYLVYAPTKIKPCKVGIVVSNKVGKAVKRNKIKRRLRVIIGEMIGNINQNYNYILVAKPEIIETDFLGLKKEVNYLFKKGNLIEQNS